MLQRLQKPFTNILRALYVNVWIFRANTYFAKIRKVFKRDRNYLKGSF